MDMKARGMFVSRMLSFSGCSFEKRECKLSEEERVLYEQAADWWVELHAAFAKCIESTGSESSGRHFWGAHQSFFKQLLNSIKCRFAIEEAYQALCRGESVVIGLLSTGEAKANEAAERESKNGRELDSEVSTPHEIARIMLEKHLPIENREGKVVPEAKKISDDLLEKLEKIKMPGNALDLLISHFGVDMVAEMTGRKMRIVTTDGKTEIQQRAANGVSQDQVNIAEKQAFLSGEKRVAIISDAASSGISLHADARFENQQVRSLTPFLIPSLIPFLTPSHPFSLAAALPHHPRARVVGREDAAAVRTHPPLQPGVPAALRAPRNGRRRRAALRLVRRPPPRAARGDDAWR